jgi:3-oxoacyl-[acyl-carrier protein] reductase
MDLGLRGKKAIITGATAGTGREVAEILAQEGVDIGFCGESALLDPTAQALRRHGINAIPGAVDVREGESYKEWLTQTATQLGGCDIFVINTGLDAVPGSHSWAEDFQIDIMPTIRGCDTLMPLLKAGGAGAVVIIGASGTGADAALMSYTAFQAGLVTYSKQLSQFVGRDLVRVNLVAPAPGKGTPAEVARTVAFLASPAASLITGAYVVPGAAKPQ